MVGNNDADAQLGAAAEMRDLAVHPIMAPMTSLAGLRDLIGRIDEEDAPSAQAQGSANTHGRHTSVISTEDFEREKVRSEASGLLDEIESLDQDAQAKLASEKSALSVAATTGKSSGISLDRIRDLIQSAKNESDAGKLETPQQKMDRLWGEVSKLNKEIDKDFDALEPWLTAEERKLRIADRKAVEEAEKERQRVYADPNATEEERRKADQRLQQANVTQAQHQETMVTRVERDNPNNPEVTTITAPLKTKMEERDQALADIEFGINSRERVEANKQPVAAPSPAAPSPIHAGTDQHDATMPTAVKEAKAVVSPTLVASFGGFGTDGETSAQPPIALKDAKTAVSPTLVASFSGFDAPEGAPSQTPGAKPKDVPSRQT